MEHVTQTDPDRKARLMKELDGFLERDRDRELFDLAPIGSYNRMTDEIRHKQLIKVTLPVKVPPKFAPSLALITEALGVPRDILASDEEIQEAWRGLPRRLNQIPPELRSESLARMCVAVASGLFDAAINYVWNASITELRNKVRYFGVHIVPEITRKPFEEKTLEDLKDVELLNLCLSLNLITEGAYFFLEQCREVRNNFSTAHPPMESLDDTEFLRFVNLCAKYALSSTQNPRGVRSQEFIAALKGQKFDPEQLEEWVLRLTSTHTAQLRLLIGMLHGMYCDPASSEEHRLNALNVCHHFAAELAPQIKSDLINKHSEYIAQGKTKRQTASQQFFSQLGLLSLLTENELHTLISNACHKLLSVHQAWDNFHNEPPFAERLLELSAQTTVPHTAQEEFVHVLAICGTGNRYGVSNRALPSYQKMVSGLSPMQVVILLEAPEKNSLLAFYLQTSQCWLRFKDLLGHVDKESVPAKSKRLYRKWARS